VREFEMRASGKSKLTGGILSIKNLSNNVKLKKQNAKRLFALFTFAFLLM
jgi:hypothetical protein